MANKPSLLSTLPTNPPAQFLKDITDGFSETQMLGEGAFGTVYKGILQDGQPIAVKKLAENAPVAPEKQFKIGVGNLMAMQHPNIVRILGYCREPQRKVIEQSGRYIIVDVVESLLYYEYVPNGNLEKYISDASASRPDWKTCFEIIKGICQGLRYLHKEMDRPIVHLDLHPTNILLDENMVPKITDFGLSRLFGEEQTRINTINVVGKKCVRRGQMST
uniref:non-specific serine/threonine protein kinase n=1 Tax=Zea mays TaxID=4577 RepID=A0A804P0W6_MAIZE